MPWIEWLKGEGFEFQPGGERRSGLGQPDERASLQHPEFGWAHVSRFRVVVECTLHPGVLGETKVFTELQPAKDRLNVIRQRAATNISKVWSEKPPRKQRW